MNYDFTPKPAYRILEQLIKHEWHTETTLDYHRPAENMFHGFYGDYETTIQTDKGTFTRTISLSKDSDNMIRITL